MQHARPPLRVASVVATVVVALSFGIGGIAHIVGVTHAAIARGGLFDARHALLLVVGWTLVAPAVGFGASALAMWRGRAWAYGAALALAAFLLVEMVIVGSSLGTRSQTLPAYAAALGYLALVALSGRRDRA